LKLFALVLTRLGMRVTITSRGKIWTFLKRDDPRFSNDVNVPESCLHWDQAVDPNANENANKVIVKVQGLLEEQWKDQLNYYLWLTPEDPGRVVTAHGELLLGPLFRHKLYVKGIHVMDCTIAGAEYLNYGFNTTDELDRDRNCVPNLDQRHRSTSQILADIVSNIGTNPQKYYEFLPGEYTPMLDNITADVYQSLVICNVETWHFAHYLTQTGADRIWEEWRKDLQSKNEWKDGIQPVYHNPAAVVEFIKKFQLPHAFYEHTISRISWQLWPVLAKSKYYESVQTRFQTLLNGAPLSVVPIPADYEVAIQEVVAKIQRCFPAFTREMICFKTFSPLVQPNTAYTSNGCLYFSDKRHLNPLVPGERQIWQQQLLGRALELKSVSLELLIQKFYLI